MSDALSPEDALNAWRTLYDAGKPYWETELKNPRPSDYSFSTYSLITFEPDECCLRRIMKTSREGKLTGDSWTCPKCWLEWKPQQIGIATHWKPHPLLAIIR